MGAVAGIARGLALPAIPPARALKPAPAVAPVDPSAATPSAIPFDIGVMSSASGEFTVDWARAYSDAAATLAQIDFSKRDIVIWSPGTSNHKVLPPFGDAVRAAYGDDASISYLKYEATWHMRRSAPTGLATLMIVLAEIKKRKRAGQRVFLAGESQGAWIIGEAMTKPVASIVERAAIVGHPYLAKHHYDDGHDPRVQEMNHEGDNVAAKINGDIATGLDAMVAIRTGQLGKIGTILKGIAANPMQGVILLRDMIYNLPFLKGKNVKPHYYEYEMDSVVKFLHDGVRSPSVKPPMAPADLVAWEKARARR